MAGRSALKTAQHALYFLTGSSGSGKTTLLERVKADVYPEIRALHVDTHQLRHDARGWIEEALTPPSGSPLMVVDAQERPHLLLAAQRELGLERLHILLVDCGHEERRRRLRDERGQPELDVLDMYAWAAYLAGQAHALGLEQLDTTSQTLSESVAQLAASIDRFARSAGVVLTPATPTLDT